MALRVLFVPIFNVGHMNPSIGIAEHMIAAGHRVLFTVNEHWLGRLNPYGIEEVVLADYEVPFRRAVNTEYVSRQEFKICNEICDNLRQEIKLFHVINDYYYQERQNVLFVTTDDRVYGLGSNSYGVLGLGHNRPIHTPEEVPQLSHQNIQQFFFEKEFVLALNRDQQIYGWRLNKRPNGNTYNKPHKILLKTNNIEMYEILEKLGSGSFGHVFKVNDRHNGDKYAVKKCPLNGLDEKQKQNVLNETQNLIKLRSEYIIQYYYSWIECNCLYILMDCLAGNLTQFLDNKKPLFGEIISEFEYYISYEIFKQLVESVEYLHKNHIIHRDLKPDNVLIDNNDRYNRYIKLCDFGLSKSVDVLSDGYKQSSVKHTKDVGDIEYQAPEAQTTEYNHLIDVYSLALIGAKIFSFNSSNSEIEKNTKNRKYIKL
ncbi:unnamed protein product [Medioppia subpectinata]|uniref:Protein kinase domain-containing protein n=1 Tax=Medioppia subpectinata TaxID=1979941 RepID=A0A7R9KYG2_9ACAR|nr:unnamed protein product [Medioppia subpectinata]CAG2112157.1 unnamed protein product [Medioppia subpectinata]